MEDGGRPWAELRALALAAARAGAAAIDAVARVGELDIAAKAGPGDLVTRADVASERAIIEHIRAERPHDAVLAEESGEHAGTSGVRWVVDPLDGTVNFVHGRRDWAVAVAAEVDGTLAAGAVFRPAHRDWFAGAGGEALGSAGPPLANRSRRLGEAIVSVAVPPWQNRRDHALSLLTGLLPHVRDFRRTGCAAVELTDLAVGALDAFIGFTPKPWDLLPGLAVALAAGARQARVATPSGDLVVVSAPALLDELVDRVEGAVLAEDRDGR
jgi:myo-inositol-1(or 4)-monophosphatase